MSLRVLVVDDHAIVREGLRRLITKDESITVVGEAASKREAFAQISHHNPDVIVVGAGNAAACAALAAREHGASVIMLEAAPLEEAGGNSRYTAGAMRVVFNGPEDLKQIIFFSKYCFSIQPQNHLFIGIDSF